MICNVCLEELERFDTYRNTLVLTFRFMEGLIDLKESNSKPLSALFKKSKRELNVLFKDLSLCNNEQAEFDDLLKEFETYDFAKFGEEVKVKEESQDVEPKAELNFMMVDGDDPDDDPDFEMGGDHNSDSDSDLESKLKSEVVYAEPLVQKPSTERKTRSSSESTPKKRGRPKADSSKSEEGTATKRKARVKKDPDETSPKKPKAATPKSEEGSETKKKGGRPRIHPDGTFLKEIWSCEKCAFKTKYRIAVDRHKAVHEKRENRMYPCNECTLSFKTWNEMTTHAQSHPENQVICEVCGASLRNPSSLRAHMERHEDSRKYSCEYCDYNGNTKLSLRAHMNIHTKKDLNKRCEVCGLVFAKASRLKRHMESHGNERKYACEQCPARFNTNNALRNHHTRVHLAIRHPCDHCDKNFDQKIILRDHMERVHHIQCTFICDVCVATFDSQEKLDTHKQRHSNPKPMECSICLTLSLTPEAYAGHMCITYQQDYQCCGKDLRNHNQYNKHMLVKHGLKTNARVKPIPGMLLGQLRGSRKRIEQCRKCDIAFPSKALKMQHLAICNSFQQEPDVDSVSSY